VAIGNDITEEDILEYVQDPPEDEEVLAQIAEQKLNEGYLKDSNGNIVPWSKLSNEYYGIEWYVLKYEWNEAWHIDGRLVENATNNTVTIYTPPAKEEIPIEAYTPEYEEPTALTNDYAYIFGRTDTIMEPEDNMRRGEAAAVLYRLLKQNDQLINFAYDVNDEPIFEDTVGRWDRSALEYMYDIGVFPHSGTINPDQNITRGEAFKMIALALGFIEDTSLQDEQYAAILVNKGYVEGYDNATSNPTVDDLQLDSFITRAEFCKIYNLIINRSSLLLVTEDGEEITAETYGFTDIDENAWYYEDMVKATSAFENGKVSLEKRGIRNYLDDFDF